MLNLFRKMAPVATNEVEVPLPEVQYDVRQQEQRDELAAQKLKNEEARANRLAVKLMNMRDALRDIAAMETPNCANIGKKMARRARQEIA